MSKEKKKSGKKNKTGGKSDKAFLGRIREAWKLSVGEYAVEEGETRSLLGRLEALGTVTKEDAKQVLNYAKKNIEKNRLELEKRVEESVKNATARLIIPTDDEIRDLRKRIIAAEKRIVALEESEREGGEVS